MYLWPQLICIGNSWFFSLLDLIHFAIFHNFLLVPSIPQSSHLFLLVFLTLSLLNFIASSSVFGSWISNEFRTDDSSLASDLLTLDSTSVSNFYYVKGQFLLQNENYQFWVSQSVLQYFQQMVPSQLNQYHPDDDYMILVSNRYILDLTAGNGGKIDSGHNAFIHI